MVLLKAYEIAYRIYGTVQPSLEYISDALIQSSLGPLNSRLIDSRKKLRIRNFARLSLDSLAKKFLKRLKSRELGILPMGKSFLRIRKFVN